MDLDTAAGRLLDLLDVLRHASDLDLLIFLARHPRSLLSSEQIAAFLGYSVKEVAASLELLLEAGFLTRRPNPRHVARMYLLTATPPGADGSRRSSALRPLGKPTFAGFALDLGIGVEVRWPYRPPEKAASRISSVG